MIWRRSFERRFDALTDIFALTAEAGAGVGAEVRNAVDFALEELFTNVVKYGRGVRPVTVDVEPIPGGLSVVFEDPDAEEFDVTQAPDANTGLPLEQRQPGGLGLHLLRRMVEGLEYRYIAAQRTSQIRFRKTTRQE